MAKATDESPAGEVAREEIHAAKVRGYFLLPITRQSLREFYRQEASTEWQRSLEEVIAAFEEITGRRPMR